jgi:hypothetical protein
MNLDIEIIHNKNLYAMEPFRSFHSLFNNLFFKIKDYYKRI